MNRNVEVNYQSIIIDENKQKETIRFQRIGKHKVTNKQYHLIFELDTQVMMTIIYFEDCVNFMYGKNNLKFKLDKRIENLYHTFHGAILLSFDLKKIHYSKHDFKMVYEISQQQKIISKIYLSINLKEI